MPNGIFVFVVSFSVDIRSFFLGGGRDIWVLRNPKFPTKKSKKYGVR